MMFDRSYFLEPDSKSSKSYVLLAKTLADTDRNGDRAFLAAQQDAAGGLARQGFRQARRDGGAHLVVARRDPRPRLPVLDKKVDIKPAELKMAGQVWSR